MGQRVIADNWSLQAVSELFKQGLDPDDNPGIAPLTDPDKTVPALPQAVVNLEALLGSSSAMSASSRGLTESLAAKPQQGRHVIVLSRGAPPFAR